MFFMAKATSGLAPLALNIFVAVLRQFSISNLNSLSSGVYLSGAAVTFPM